MSCVKVEVNLHGTNVTCVFRGICLSTLLQDEDPSHIENVLRIEQRNRFLMDITANAEKAATSDVLIKDTKASVQSF